MVKASTVGDIIFALGKKGAKSADEVAQAGAGSVAKVVNKFDPSSLFKGMTGGSYYKNLEIPEIPLKTSSLFHTTGTLKNLKTIGIADLVPASTSDLLTSLSKSIDDIPANSVGDLAQSLKKVDLSDATAVSTIAKNSSLGKLQDISQQLSKQTAKQADTVAKQSDDAGKLLDDALSFKNADEMTDAMKRSNGLAKKTDDVADTTADVAKKTELGKLDDAAAQAKKSKAMQALEFAKKNEGKLSIGIVAAFMLAEHVRGSIPSQAVGPEDFVFDPGEQNAEDAIAAAETEVATIEEPGEGVLTSDAAVLGIVALGVASMVF